jgi:hypothetical protein
MGITKAMAASTEGIAFRQKLAISGLFFSEKSDLAGLRPSLGGSGGC